MSDKVKTSTKVMQIVLVVIAVAVVGFGAMSLLTPSTTKEITQYDNDF